MSARAGAVVTGIGLHTPLGGDPAEFFDALCQGRSGLTRPSEDMLDGVRVDVAAPSAPIDPLDVLPATEARLVDRFVLMAMAAADRALADAGIVVGRDVDPFRTAIVISSGGGGLDTYERQARGRHERGYTAISPYLMPGMLPNMATARVAIKHGIRGFSSSMATACAAGAHAVAEALRLIREGDVDVVVCGGADAPLHPTVIAGFANSRALARGWPEPADSSRPFDLRRNGFVLGEGAGVLVVERTDHADARGVAGYADVIGWGVTTDAHHTTMPRPDGAGAMECMRRALANAGVARHDVTYLNAHATGTKIGDMAEAGAIRSVFGNAVPAVSSIKGAIGHLLGGSGAVEAATTALAISRGALPPTRNLDAPDPDCELDHVQATRLAKTQVAMSNSFGFGGHNVCLVFGQPSTNRARYAD
jgi:3-oxoacyl-[acyl-carrier-protein] synthase II